MYKTYLSLLFLLLPSFIFSQQYYRSNSLGMELASIHKYRIDEFEYYVEKTKEEKKEIKILFKESVPIRTTELYYLDNGAIEREIIREDGIETEKVYRESLLVVEKVITLSDQSGYVKIYKYNPGLLLEAVDELSLDGRLQSSIMYERDARGRIATVVRSIYPEDDEKKEDQISKYRFEERNLLEEWHGNSDLIGNFIYYRNGRISEILKTDKGERISEKKYFYDSDLNLRIEEFIYETEERIIQNIDSEGNLLEEIIYIGEDIVSKINDYYDEDKKLVRRIKVLPEGVERYIYEYTDDELTSEKMYFNGEIYKEKVYLEDNVHYEDYYNNGEKILRIHYKDDEKTAVER
ncbi:MAG: hypothetical protein FWE72_04490 [Spirochaetaceae bacterium]|nr:hypothetical protein [Spirochaetaceae bacterium]